MKIAVASGKGGTGKTFVSTNLAYVASRAREIQFVDCDVEEPNAHIFLKPRFEWESPVNLLYPRVDFDKCTLCGVCQKICEFNAIAVLPNTVMIFDELCHACGACKLGCPEKAIYEIEKSIGVLQRGPAADGNIDFLHGILNVGEMTATPVIRYEKKLLRDDVDVILDVSPGTSCPVVTAVKDVDFVLLVAEATPFGLNDLKLTVELMKEMKLPMGVVINRYGTNFTELEEYLKEQDIPVFLKIPFRREIAEVYSRGELLTKQSPEYMHHFSKLLQDIKEYER